MKRRDFLNLSAVASIFLIAGCDIGRGNSYGRGNIQKFSDISNLEKTTTQLPIPDLIEGSQIEGVKHYNIGIKEREHSFF